MDAACLDDKDTAFQDIADPTTAQTFRSVNRVLRLVIGFDDAWAGVEAQTSDEKSSVPASGMVIQWTGMYTRRSTEINNSTGISSNLGLEAFRIPGEQTRSSNVVQFQEQHHHSLQANSATPMRNTPHLECVQIRLHRLWVNSRFTHSLLKDIGIVDALCSGQYFLTSHEKVVRVGEGLWTRALLSPDLYE